MIEPEHAAITYVRLRENLYIPRPECTDAHRLLAAAASNEQKVAACKAIERAGVRPNTFADR